MTEKIKKISSRKTKTASTSKLKKVKDENNIIDKPASPIKMDKICFVRGGSN